MTSQSGIEKVLATLSDTELAALEHNWKFWARPNQLPPPGDWSFWLILAGRGFGKSRSGAEQCRFWANAFPGCRIAMAGPTAAAVRDVMVEGESGILAIGPPSERPKYEPSKCRLTWKNGSQASTYSADKPDKFRGPQHHFAWADEIASWRYPAAWDMLLFGLRLGARPQAVVTTTPRPIPIVKELLSRVGRDVVVSRGSSYENKQNLPDAFFAQIVRRYEGTRLGRQELYAEILDDNPGALWRRDNIDQYRVCEIPKLKRIVVAIDPAVSSNEDSDETGIVVVGMTENKECYVLDDVSGIYTPLQWATVAKTVYNKYQADRVIAETNNGGDLVEANMRTVWPSVPFTKVTATRGKQLRAEPVASLYEQGRVHHVGMLSALEDQMCSWDPIVSERSPDRLDALVWAVTDLAGGPAKAPRVKGTAAERELEMPTVW